MLGLPDHRDLPEEPDRQHASPAEEPNQKYSNSVKRVSSKALGIRVFF